MKKLNIFFVILLLLLTNTSCFPQKEYSIDVEPFVPLPVQNRSYQGIDKPKLAWTYTWGDQSDQWVGNGIESLPVVDGTGNTYIIDSENELHSISPTGKLQWKNDKSLDKAQNIKNGVLINTLSNDSIRLNLTDTEPDGLIFDGSGKQIARFDSYPYLGPDGFFYSYFQKKDDKRVARDVLNREWDFQYDRITHLYSFDTNQKIRWIFTIPQTGEEYRTLNKCFFDKNSNIYFLLTIQTSHENRYSPDSYIEIYSLTNNGKVRWKKEFKPQNGEVGIFFDYFIDFIPDQLVFNDTFLLRISDIKDSRSGKNQDIRKIISLSSEGQEIWSKSIPNKLGLLSPYSISKDSVFYLTFTDWDLEKTYVQAISKTGKTLWEKELIGMESTSPILDSEGNIYIGAGGGFAGKKYCDRYLYSFTSGGQLRWKMLQPNPSQNYEYSLVLGPNRRIYYGCFGKNILYCIENE